MNVALDAETNYIEQLKSWSPGDPLPTLIGPTGVMTPATTAGQPYIPTAQVSAFAKYLPYILIAGVAVTLFMLWQRSRAEGY